MVNFSLRAFVALFILLSVSSVFAQTKVVVIPLFGDDPPAPVVYAIGDLGPAGGIVFHVINGGLNGLEAAPVDQGTTVPWNCGGTDVTGVDNITLVGTVDSHSGAHNTPLIAAQCPGTATNAAVLATVYRWPSGQMDGFLPNKEELHLLYDQKDVVGGYTSSLYLSSSELNTVLVWQQSFVSGLQSAVLKSNFYGVRAVRAF